MLPKTRSGWQTLALLGFAVLLYAGRLLLTPTLGVPLNFLMVFLVAAAAGLMALYAVALRRERSLSVFATLVIGLVAGIWVLAEAINPAGG
jgi:hypothetical protein